MNMEQIAALVRQKVYFHLGSVGPGVAAAIENAVVEVLAAQEEPKTRKHSHYYKNVAHLDYVDVYRVLALFDVTDPALQHAAKKILCAGERGAKNFRQDVQEAADTLARCLEMLGEDDGR